MGRELERPRGVWIDTPRTPAIYESKDLAVRSTETKTFVWQDPSGAPLPAAERIDSQATPGASKDRQWTHP